jgi:4-hydroxymandelate oxidase
MQGAGAYQQLREEARDVLDSDVFTFIDHGAGEERSARGNAEAWGRYWLRPRVVRDVAEVDLSTDFLGMRFSMPVILGPTSRQRLIHPDGEYAPARAAHASGTAYAIAMRATTDLADLTAAVPGCLWSQLFMHRDRGRTYAVADRAAELGYSALVLTVDKPVAGIEMAAGWKSRPEIRIASQIGGGSEVDEGPTRSEWDATLTWDALSAFIENMRLPVVVKGILTSEDAELCADAGAAAVVVSNHGGRQLDGIVPTAFVLPEITERLAGRIPVLVDGGVRTGSDVFRALALGAAGAMLGRAYLWGLACGGQQGVEAVLNRFTSELAKVMQLMGCPGISDIEHSHVRTKDDYKNALDAQ